MFTILADSMMVASRLDRQRLHDKPGPWDELADRPRHRRWLRLFRH